MAWCRKEGLLLNPPDAHAGKAKRKSARTAFSYPFSAWRCIPGRALARESYGGGGRVRNVTLHFFVLGILYVRCLHDLNVLSRKNQHMYACFIP